MLSVNMVLSAVFPIVVYILDSAMVRADPVPCPGKRYDGWCFRNGTCMHIFSPFGDNYYCECPPGWTGKRCEKVTPSTTPPVPTTTTADPRICPGHSLQCVNGVCHLESDLQGVSTPYCLCFNGWSGEDCSLLCNKTCYHGGTCRAYNVTSDGFLQECVCTGDYLPPQCTYCKPERATDSGCDNVTLVRKLQEIDECERSCIHGTCPGVDSMEVTCACKDGWVGRHCDVECTHFCDNGGKCASLNGDPYVQGCDCPSNWRGKNCEIRCKITRNGTYDCSPFSAYKDDKPEITEENRRRCRDNCLHGGCVGFRNTTHRAYAFAFECQCSSMMWVGEWCNIRCPCKNTGRCIISNNEIWCNCPVSHRGPLCNETISPIEPEIRSIKTEVPIQGVNHLWRIVIGCLLGLVGLIGALCSLMYILGRRRILWVMKVKYFFQPSEQNDGRSYDAFVSYCACNPDHTQSEDEQFVFFKLRQKLENDLGYSLCLHQRDFIPGESIADNIISAVDKSRRTILVLSQRYVKSEWCKLEYNVAHQEMLKLQHRIIPIMLENLDDLLVDEPILKKILKNITYIKYPGDENEKKLEHFWKKMQYSMPKKRVLSDQCLNLGIEEGESVVKGREEHELHVL